MIRPEYEFTEFVVFLIDEDITLYHKLLRNENLKIFHLAPLSGQIDDDWIEKAKLALDMGYSNKEIAFSIYGTVGVSIEWIGSESAMWLGWIRQFDKLSTNEDECIRKVGEIGKAHAEKNYVWALEEEKREAIYGI